jgi:hypothetical protein
VPILSIPYITLNPHNHARPLQASFQLGLFVFRRFTLPIFREQPSSALSIQVGIFTPIGDILEQARVGVRVNTAFQIE